MNTNHYLDALHEIISQHNGANELIKAKRDAASAKISECQKSMDEALKAGDASAYLKAHDALAFNQAYLDQSAHAMQYTEEEIDAAKAIIDAAEKEYKPAAAKLYSVLLDLLDKGIEQKEKIMQLNDEFNNLCDAFCTIDSKLDAYKKRKYFEGLLNQVLDENTPTYQYIEGQAAE